jgi:hypothetical protein
MLRTRCGGIGANGGMVVGALLLCIVHRGRGENSRMVAAMLRA